MYLKKRYRTTDIQTGKRQRIDKKDKVSLWGQILEGDFTAPGYNYFGKGNKLNKGEPTNENDGVAQEHDYVYDDLEKKGIDPYWTYNYADEDFNDKLKPNDIWTYGGSAFFKGKRIAARMGLINSHMKRPKDPHKYWQQRDRSTWYGHGETKEEDPRNIPLPNTDDKDLEEPKSIPPTPTETRAQPATAPKNNELERKRKAYDDITSEIQGLQQKLKTTSNDSIQRRIKEQIGILKIHAGQMKQGLDKEESAGTSQDTEPATNLNTSNNGSLSNSTDSTNMANRRPETDAPMPGPIETQRSANTQSGTTAGNTKHGGETQLANIPYTIYRPYPSTNQVLMPFYYKYDMTVNNNSYATQGFRLNSIYDVLFSTASPTSDHGTIGGNAAASDVTTLGGAGTYNHPFMRDFWKNIYNYYSVVQCRYKYTCCIKTATARGEIAIYEYLHGQQGVPELTADSALIAHRYRQRHPHCKYQFIRANPVQTTSGVYPNTLNNEVTFRGTWQPGLIKHEVVEDELREVWTKMNTTPKNHEKLTILMQQSQQNDSTDNMTVSVVMEMEFVVQLKDLKLYYEYIEPGFDTVAVANAFTQTTD